MAGRKTGRRIRKVQNVTGKEFISTDVENLFRAHRNRLELTAAYSIHQNALAERMNRTLTFYNISATKRVLRFRLNQLLIIHNLHNIQAGRARQCIQAARQDP